MKSEPSWWFAALLVFIVIIILVVSSGCKNHGADCTMKSDKGSTPVVVPCHHGGNP